MINLSGGPPGGAGGQGGGAPGNGGGQGVDFSAPPPGWAGSGPSPGPGQPNLMQQHRMQQPPPNLGLPPPVMGNMPPGRMQQAPPFVNPNVQPQLIGQQQIPPHFAQSGPPPSFHPHHHQFPPHPNPALGVPPPSLHDR